MRISKYQINERISSSLVLCQEGREYGAPILMLMFLSSKDQSEAAYHLSAQP